LEVTYFIMAGKGDISIILQSTGSKYRSQILQKPEPRAWKAIEKHKEGQGIPKSGIR
jgi:hypothetical protein